MGRELLKRNGTAVILIDRLKSFTQALQIRRGYIMCANLDQGPKGRPQTGMRKETRYLFVG